MFKECLKVQNSLARGMTFCKSLHQLGFMVVIFHTHKASACAQLQSSPCKGSTPGNHPALSVLCEMKASRSCGWNEAPLLTSILSMYQVA